MFLMSEVPLYRVVLDTKSLLTNMGKVELSTAAFEQAIIIIIIIDFPFTTVTSNIKPGLV